MENKTKRTSGPQLFLSFWKTSRAVMRADQQSIAALGFNSLSDFAVLEVLLHKGPLPVNTIGEKVLLTSGSITSAVQRLEKQDLVTRVRGEGDARVVVVYLTAAGRTLIEKAFDKHAEHLEEIFADLSEIEKNQFLKILKKVRMKAINQNQKRSES